MNETRRVKGSELKVGDSIKVWWKPKVDTITALHPYTGPLTHLFPEGAQIAEFAILRGGMTIDNSDYEEVVARMNP